MGKGRSPASPSATLTNEKDDDFALPCTLFLLNLSHKRLNDRQTCHLQNVDNIIIHSSATHTHIYNICGSYRDESIFMSKT